MKEKEIREDSGATFFASANSGSGFVSFYPEVFGGKNIEKRYLIKGGPGTGKSTLMRKIAQMAEKNGFYTERYRCSSDPESLDGVIIDRRVAMIDATAPHAVEATVVGAKDELVDLGAFLDTDGLRGCRERIEEITRAKAKEYAACYTLLCAAKDISRAEKMLFSEHFKTRKMLLYAKNAARQIKKGEGYSVRVGLCRAIGMSGEVRLCSYESMAERIWWIKDIGGGGAMLLKMLIAEAQKKRSPVYVSYCPLEPDEPDALLFTDTKTAFVIGEGYVEGKENRHLDIKRFVELSRAQTADLGRSLREHEGAKNAVMSLAHGSLTRAGEYHFLLEDIYSSYVDFCALNDFSDAFVHCVIEKVKATALK